MDRIGIIRILSFKLLLVIFTKRLADKILNLGGGLLNRVKQNALCNKTSTSSYLSDSSSIRSSAYPPRRSTSGVTDLLLSLCGPIMGVADLLRLSGGL